MKSLFLISENYTNYNHGSYGSAPKYVHEKVQQYQYQIESNADLFFRVDLHTQMLALRSKVASYLHCDSEDIVFLDNASTAVNSILKSFHLKNNESILYYSIAYGMVKLTLQFVTTEYYPSEKLIQIPLNKFTIQSAQQIIEITKPILLEHNIKAVILDHISSTPAVVFDIKSLIQFFKQNNVVTIIDGAHAIGQIPLDLKDMDADFYLTNAHKWLYSHRGSAILYVKKEFQKIIHPVITSFGYPNGGYWEEFKYTGTRDYSNYFSIGDAIDFRANMLGGEELIYEYNHGLAIYAGKLLATMWNTEVLMKDEKCIGFMNNVRVPVSTVEEATQVYQTLIQQYGIFLPIFEFDGSFYARISAQVYLDKSDFEKLGRIVLQILKK